MKIIITESQHQTVLLETISTYLRRRMSMDVMKGEMDAIIEYHMLPCEFKNAGDFVAEACDMMTYGYLEDINVSAKDTDSFYYHMVDLFKDYLSNHYNKKCGKKLRTESVRKIIITESQLDIIIPKPLRRRLDNIENLMYDVMMNHAVSLDVEDYDIEDFVNYIIDLVIYNVFPETPDKDIPAYEKSLSYLVGDKIREFWKDNKI